MSFYQPVAGLRVRSPHPCCTLPLFRMPSAHPVSSFLHFLLLSSGHLASSPSKHVYPHWPAEAANWVSRIGNS